MIYNIYYNDKNLLNKKIQKITTLKHQNIYFQENDFKNIINLLKQINLFESEKRVFIIHDATFLTNIKIFKKINELINIILSVSDNNFIFLLNNKKKSIANKEINDFLSKTKEIIIPNLTNRTKTQYMLKHELFKEKNFSEEEINNISDNLPLDSMIIDHELNKLSTLMISSNSDDELDVLSIYQEANLFVLRSYANTYSFVCVKYLTIIINQLYLLDKEMKSFSDNKKIIFSFFLLKYL